MLTFPLFNAGAGRAIPPSVSIQASLSLLILELCWWSCGKPWACSTCRWFRTYRASVKINLSIDLDRPVRLLGLGGNYSVVHGREVMASVICSLLATAVLPLIELIISGLPGLFAGNSWPGVAAGGKTGNVASYAGVYVTVFLPVIYT